jgi:hypothetical protein
MREGLRATAVVSLPVCYRDIRLGVVVDLLLDHGYARVLGLDVLCGDRAHRFLPFPACEVRSEGVIVPSALVLMSQELDFYRDRCRSLNAVRGFPVRRGETELGTLGDFEVAPDGAVARLLVESSEGVRAVRVDGRVLLGPDALRPAV